MKNSKFEAQLLVLPCKKYFCSSHLVTMKSKSVWQLKLKVPKDDSITGKKLALQIHISLSTSYNFLDYMHT